MQILVEPNLSEYGLTEARYQKLKTSTAQWKKKKDDSVIIPWCVFFIVFFSLKHVDELAAVIFAGVSFVIMIITCNFLINFYRSIRLDNFEDKEAFNAYEKARFDYEHEKYKFEAEQKRIRQEEAREKARKEKLIKQQHYDYWTSIDPYKFEREIAILFEKNGYSARVTKGSGDEGIDIFLNENDGQQGIVQCKRFSKKVGPATLRDLYGTMLAGGYKYGFVVCPSGFSDKAYEFSKGKNIKLIGLKRIIEMVNS